MKRRGYLFELVCDVKNIELAIDKAARNKRWRRNIKKTLARKHEAAKEISELLKSGSFHTSRYHEKILYEPKERTIFSLPFYPDRIVHHAIMNVIEPLWNNLLDVDSHSCRKGKGCCSASRRCMMFIRHSKYVLQSDIKKFYPSVDHNICKKVVRKKIKDPKLLALIDEIIDSANKIPGATIGKNAPIGNLLSQWLGNLYLNELDLYLRHKCGVKSMVRYCDDFLVFSNSKKFLNELKEKITEFVGSKLDLRLSKSRLYPVSRGIDFVGYRHFLGFLLVRKRTAKKIKRFARKYFEGKIKDKKHARGTASSYKGVMKHANTHRFRTSLNFNTILAETGVHNVE